jgi:WD40 repeat protein
MDSILLVRIVLQVMLILVRGPAPARVGELHASNMGTWSFNFSRDGSMLAACCCDKIAVWNVQTRNVLTRLNVPENDIIQAILFTADKKGLITYVFDKSTIQIWDLGSKKIDVTLRGHGGRVKAMALSPNGKLLASGDEMGIVKLWDLNSRKELPFPEGKARDLHVSAMAFSPDGKTLAVAFAGGLTWRRVLKCPIRRPARDATWPIARPPAVAPRALGKFVP